MFEKLIERARRRAEERALLRRDEIAARLEAELPRGVSAQAAAGGVRLSGRALKRRAALDQRLRALLGSPK